MELKAPLNLNNMNIDINAITVCVNYGNYLKYCISNKRFFKRWIIVTVEHDIETIDICKKNGLEYIISKKLYSRQFAKGCAINEALEYIGYNEDWYLHIDADVLLPDNFGDTFIIDEETEKTKIIGLKRPKCIEGDKLDGIGPYQIYEELVDEKLSALNLYTIGRINVDEGEYFKNFNPQFYFDQPDKIIQGFKGYGYFQLWHMPTLFEVYSDLYHVYPSLSKNAGHDDFIFAKMFYQVISLDSYCIHLSPEKIGWDGV